VYVFVYLDDGTAGGSAYSNAVFVVDSHVRLPSDLVSPPNYYWVDINDNQNLQILYQGQWTMPPINVNGFPSAWGDDREAGYITITIVPGRVEPASDGPGCSADDNSDDGSDTSSDEGDDS